MNRHLLFSNYSGNNLPEPTYRVSLAASFANWLTLNVLFFVSSSDLATGACFSGVSGRIKRVINELKHGHSVSS